MKFKCYYYSTFIHKDNKENSNHLPKETHRIGSKVSILTQAIWHHSQYFGLPCHVASLEDNFIARSVRLAH